MSPGLGVVDPIAAGVRSIAAAIILFGPVGVVAQPVTGPDPTSQQGWSLYIGYNSDYKKATLAYETPNIWAHQFQNGWGRIDLNIELGLSYWKAKRAGPGTMWQLSAIPMLRWWPNEDIYLEVGSGPTVLSRSEFAGRDLSTRFQFGSHLGTGILIKKAHRVGIRYSHYSNASIKKPNPGLDLLALTYAYRF